MHRTTIGPWPLCGQDQFPFPAQTHRHSDNGPKADCVNLYQADVEHAPIFHQHEAA
ncbi:hypothetical protein [Komagataeibacter saccharivorans]|uniref:hypothetical protein n=1 Tax=Komagataeibacter saccharivorans TaxID=265959 RepID=UPI0013C2AD34|nr:hypothetical protein [Komagataeibacter saccharivorans]